MRQVLRQIGAGTGIPYELLSGDLSQVNYSSAKAGFSQFFRRCRAIRASLLQARCLDLIWQRVVTLEILSGRLQAPDFERDAESFFAVNWGWPAWPSLDPLKEVNADVAAINAGIKSRQQVVEEGGRDVEDVDSEIAADNFIPRTNATAGNAPANGVAP
jgi:lambda family phage portal protein